MIALIDEDLPKSLGTGLKTLGWRVLDIRDLGLRGSSDETVFRVAKKHKAILFSADLGFANILRFPPGSHYGIMILRFPNELPTKALSQSTYKALNTLTAKDIEGNLVIIEPGKIRIRRKK